VSTRQPRYFLTQSDKIFLIRRKKIEKFEIFERNSPGSWVADPTLPEQQKNYPTRSKNFGSGAITTFM